MRLGFRKASNGSSRGKQLESKDEEHPAARRATTAPARSWPPLWPGDDASGRGGIGPGGRGCRAAAERSGRGGAFAVRARTNGEDPTTVGDRARPYQGVAQNVSSLGLRANRGAWACFLAGAGAAAPAACAQRVSALGRSRGRLRDRQLRVCALGREGGCSRARTGDGVLGQRHGLGDDDSSPPNRRPTAACAAPSADVDDPLTCVERSPGPSRPPPVRSRDAGSPRNRAPGRATGKPAARCNSSGRIGLATAVSSGNRPIGATALRPVPPARPVPPGGPKRAAPASEPRRREPDQQCAEQRDRGQRQRAGALPAEPPGGSSTELAALDLAQNARRGAPERRRLCSVPWRLFVTGRPGGRRRNTGGMSGCGSAERPPERLLRRIPGAIVRARSAEAPR